MAQFFLNRDLRLENTYKKYFLIFFEVSKVLAIENIWIIGISYTIDSYILTRLM